VEQSSNKRGQTFHVEQRAREKKGINRKRKRNGGWEDRE
jgi:hypothetical protein